jgi:uncharacterized membrane protein
MNLLILGLIAFLGIHSARVFAEAPRQALITRLGPMAWKGLYSLVSLLGLVLMVQGYGQARLEPVVLWVPPMGMRHLAALLTLLSFILLAAAYVPGNVLKARLRHPMTLGVKTWALAHLLANGKLADVLLFGGFLVWSVLVFRAAGARDRLQPPPAHPTRPAALLVCVAAGALAWAAFAFWAHAALIGVRPFGGA